MTLPAQFIPWKLIHFPGEPKPRKVPCDRTGRIVDAHDPANWLTEADARATGIDIGFVLTEKDPFFLIDLDKQYVDGAWSDEASRVCALFSGAAMEVSQSGTGLHIIGSCDQSIAPRLRNKWGGAFEFYTKRRFIALSRNGLTGNVHQDCTAAVLAWVPPRELGAGNLPDDGPVPEWSGPVDDDELIALMMQSHGSIAARFGDKATVAQLWTADPVVMARFFPAPGGFDHSAADAALCGLLAFWTGKDMARIDRLFRRSGLMRDKWNRTDYSTETIAGSARKVVSVYQRRLPDVAPGAAAGGSDAVAPVPAGFQTTYDQERLFAGCVYIEADHGVMCPDGDVLGPEVFRVRYGGREFQMQADGSRPSRDAFEAFTQNRSIQFPKVKRKRFFPGRPFGEVVGDEVNIYRPHVPVMTSEPVDRFLDLLSKMLPVKEDRLIVLSWLAAMVQNPGRKFQWALVFQGTEGNGKTFLLKCLEYAVGQHLTHLPNPEDMNEKYNDYIEGRLFIGVEEIHMEGRRDLLDRLKKYITNDRIELRSMGKDKRMGDNLANWIFLTNHQNAMVKSMNDRRMAIFFTAQQCAEDLERDGMSGRFFPDLWDWARAGGFAAIAGYLSRFEVVARYNPLGDCHRAPLTSSTGAAVAASLGPMEQDILDAIEADMPGFRGGWLSSIRLREHLSERGKRHVSPRALGEAVAALGYVPCPLWTGGRAPVVMMQEGGAGRPVLYCRKGLTPSSVADYLIAQGYEPPKLYTIDKMGGGGAG